MATSRDVAAIEALVHDAYVHYVTRNNKIPGPMRDIDAKRYAGLVEAGYVNLLREGADIVGVLVLIPQADSLLLDNIAVAPAAQGRGHGRTLMQFAEAHARRLGFADITLYTQESMHENLAIYRRHGYVETDRREEFGLRRVYLRKSL